MNLIVDHPELIPDPAERWDQVNSLLQVLMGRWEARVDIPPDSTRVAIHDIDKCLEALDTATAAMQTWAAESHLDRTMYKNRVRFLRKRLENPLRDYRDQLLPHQGDTGQRIASEDDGESFAPLGN